MSSVPAVADRTALAAIAEQGRALILSLQDAGGAYPASPTFSAYQGYAWFRDGSFIADGMSAAGEVDSAGAFFGWCARAMVARRDDVARIVAAAAAGEPVPDSEMLPTRLLLSGEVGAHDWWDFQLDGYGTWLWAAVAHAERHAADLEPWREAFELTVDYLISSWDRPCYDWWEEHIEQVHVSTLGCIVAGLAAAARSGILDPVRRARAEQTADAARQLILDRGVVDGHLVKWLGTSAVDASLAALLAPLGVVDPTSPLGLASVKELDRQLAVDGGVHRFLADTYFGGGQWPLLSCTLGLAWSAAGDSERAFALLRWAASTVRGGGTMPEQVADHLLDDTFVDEWVERWGPSADPLLWSYAMYLRLAVELGVIGGGRQMIRHRPFGSGHPYSIDTEQRWPVDPVAGEPLALGVRGSASVERVTLEWQRDGVAQPPVALERVIRSSRGQAVDGGHLASAQARLARASGGWLAGLDGLRAGEKLRYRFVGNDGSTRWFDTTVNGWRDSALGLREHGAPRVIAGTPSTLGDGAITRRVRFALPLAAGERVAGFGERFDALDQRGTELDSVVFEQYKSQGAERKTYLPMPFAHVVGGSGWGFHVRGSRRVWFDVGASDASKLWIEAETGPDGNLELALYDGTPREVLAAFLAEAGRAEELPDWVFRLWASGNEWNTQAEVLRQVDAHRDHDIPVGNVVIEAWSDESTFTTWRDARSAVRDGAEPKRLADFEFPPDGAWPDPKGMVDELHAREIRLHLWQIPLIKMRPHPAGQVEADADAARRDGVLIREPSPDGALRPYRNRGWWFPLGLMPDLTDERAARWWTEKRRYLVEELGIDGFKTDGGEHAWGRELVYLDDRLGDEKNNTFPVHYAKAYGDLLRRAGKAPVTFSRAGFTGSQAHGAFWAGDENSTWEAFRWSLFAGLNAAASGIVYWGWDLAGFSGDVPTAELYLRSAAAATFVPIMQYHSEFNHHRTPSRDRTPWNIAERTGDDRVLPVFRAFTQLRERLVPYLRAEAARAIGAGEPLMRPLFFDRPDDPEVWARPLQWMLGGALLVAPIVDEDAEVVEAYLPPGDWRDAFTGEAISGGRVVNRPTPIDEAPVWVREADWDRLRQVFAG